MDSSTFLTHRSKIKNPTEEQYKVEEGRYISSVYFHTLFLYVITKKLNYKIVQTKDNGRDDEVPLPEYLKDVFRSYYSEFLLNFGMEQLIASLEG